MDNCFVINKKVSDNNCFSLNVIGDGACISTSTNTDDAPAPIIPEFIPVPGMTWVSIHVSNSSTMYAVGTNGTDFFFYEFDIFGGSSISDISVLNFSTLPISVSTDRTFLCGFDTLSGDTLLSLVDELSGITYFIDASTHSIISSKVGKFFTFASSGECIIDTKPFLENPQGNYTHVGAVTAKGQGNITLYGCTSPNGKVYSGDYTFYMSEGEQSCSATSDCTVGIGTLNFTIPIAEISTYFTTINIIGVETEKIQSLYATTQLPSKETLSLACEDTIQATKLYLRKILTKTYDNRVLTREINGIETPLNIQEWRGSNGDPLDIYFRYDSVWYARAEELQTTLSERYTVEPSDALYDMSKIETSKTLLGFMTVVTGHTYVQVKKWGGSDMLYSSASAELTDFTLYENSIITIDGTDAISQSSV